MQSITLRSSSSCKDWKYRLIWCSILSLSHISLSFLSKFRIGISGRSLSFWFIFARFRKRLRFCLSEGVRELRDWRVFRLFVSTSRIICWHWFSISSAVGAVNRSSHTIDRKISSMLFQVCSVFGRMKVSNGELAGFGSGRRGSFPLMDVWTVIRLWSLNFVGLILILSMHSTSFVKIRSSRLLFLVGLVIICERKWSSVRVIR